MLRRGRDHTGECHFHLSPWKRQERRDFLTIPPPPAHSMEGKTGERFPPYPTPTLQRHWITLWITLCHFTRIRNHVLGPREGLLSLSLPSVFQVSCLPGDVHETASSVVLIDSGPPGESPMSFSGRACGDKSGAVSQATPASSPLWNHQDKLGGGDTFHFSRTFHGGRSVRVVARPVS